VGEHHARLQRSAIGNGSGERLKWSEEDARTLAANYISARAEAFQRRESIRQGGKVAKGFDET
jgi:hypothetical protein